MRLKSLNKFLACLMATLMILTSLSVGIATAETEGYFQYEIIDNISDDAPYAVITKYHGSDSVVTVPSAIGGYPVKGVEYSAFIGNSAVTSVIVSEGVEYIGDDVFKNCVNLTELNLPSTLNSIGCNIIAGTAISENSENWNNNLLYIGKYLLDFDDSSEAEEITIKEGTEIIASFTFGFTDIKSVNLPQSLKVIDSMAFSFCENLESVTFPKNLESINNWAFENCNKLTEVTIPDSVKNFGFGVFAECKNLKTVILSDNTKKISMGMFEGCKNLENITIPSSVTYIESYAFAESGLKTVTIPATVKFIENQAFADCDKLTEINTESSDPQNFDFETPFYYSVDGVLYSKSKYTQYEYINGVAYEKEIFPVTLYSYPAGKTDDTFTLSSDVENVYAYAFSGVNNLKTIELNSRITAFCLHNATSVEKVEVSEYNSYIYDVDGVVFSFDRKLLYYPNAKKDKNYTVPSDVNTIKEFAFSDNPYLKELTICENTEVTLEDFSIYNCDGLEVINLSNNLRIKDILSIDNCDNLKTINFNGTKTQWDTLKITAYTNSTQGLYLNTSDGSFELVAPYEEETDFTYTTEPTEPDVTEPDESTPVTSETTEPSKTEVTTQATEPVTQNSTAVEPSESETVTKPLAPLFEKGDVNTDGKLNIRDATAIQKHLAKIATLSDETLELADYNEDGKVNVRDATTIQKKIAGLI